MTLGNSPFLANREIALLFTLSGSMASLTFRCLVKDMFLSQLIFDHARVNLYHLDINHESQMIVCSPVTRRIPSIAAIPTYNEAVVRFDAISYRSLPIYHSESGDCVEHDEGTTSSYLWAGKSLFIVADDAIVEPSNGPCRLRSISCLMFKRGIVVIV